MTITKYLDYSEAKKTFYLKKLDLRFIKIVVVVVLVVIVIRKLYLIRKTSGLGENKE